MKRWHFIVILIAAVLLAIWLTGGFKKTAEKAPVVEAAPAVPTQSAPATTAEPEVQAPLVVEPSEAIDSAFDPMANLPKGFEPQFADRETRIWHSYRLEVNEAGERDQAALVVLNDLPFLRINRVVPDDHLTQAWCQQPGSDQKVDILDLLGMIEVPAGGTGDQELNNWLEKNEVNIVDGEILIQNSVVLQFENVKAGFTCYFFVEDDENLGVNVGLDILTGGQLPESRVEYINK